MKVSGYMKKERVIRAQLYQINPKMKMNEPTKQNQNKIQPKAVDLIMSYTIEL